MNEIFLAMLVLGISAIVLISIYLPLAFWVLRDVPPEDHEEQRHDT